MAQYIKEPSYRKDKKLPDFIQRGKVLILRRQFQEAVKVCRLGLLAHPTYVEGRLVLGMALIALTRYDEVLAEMRVALEVDPDNSMAYQLKGEALFSKGDYLHAQEALVRAQSLDPHNVKVQKLLDKLNEISASGAKEVSAYKTDTKVYPAQKAQDLGPDREPSEVFDSMGSYQEWGSPSIYSVKGAQAQRATGRSNHSDSDHDQGRANNPRTLGGEERLDQALSGLMDDPSTLRNARFNRSTESSEDEDYNTAPFIAPTYLVQKPPPQSAAKNDWDDPTFSENIPGYFLGEDDPGQELTERGEGLVMSFSSLHPQPDPDNDEPWSSSDDDPDTVRESGVDGLQPDPTVENLFDSSPAKFNARDEYQPDEMSEENFEYAGRDAAIDTQDLGDIGRQYVDANHADLHLGVVLEGGEEDEDEETMVNNEVPPPEALFGESAPGLVSYPSAAESPIRRATDPTKTLSLEPTFVPNESQGIPLDEMDIFDSEEGLSPLQDNYHDSQASGAERYEPPAATEARVVSGIEVDQSPQREDFTPPLANPYSDSQLSEISVVMLPDELEMPPIPDDVSHPSVRDVSAAPLHIAVEAHAELEQNYEEHEFQSPAMDQLESLGEDPDLDGDPDLDEDAEDSDSQTRVHFEVADKNNIPPDPLFEVAAGLRAVERGGASAGSGLLDDSGELPPESFQDIYPDEVSREIYNGGLPLEENPFHQNAVGFDNSYPDQLDHGRGGHQPERLELPRVSMYEPEPAGDPAMGMLPHLQDDEELALEPADIAERQPQGGRLGRTEISHDDRRKSLYRDAQWPKNSTSTITGTPKGSKGDLRGGPGEPHPMDSGLHDSRAFLREAAERVRKAQKKHHIREKTATSILTLLIGGPGSYRWVFFLLSSVGVLVLAVGIGLAVRYFRLGEQIELKRKQAESRLLKGNLTDFTSAAQYYTDILSRRPDDEEAIWAKQRIQAAIPFEFGDPIIPAKINNKKSKAINVDQYAALIYSHLNEGSLAEANKTLSSALRQFPRSALLQYLGGRIRLLEGNGSAAVQSLEKAAKIAPPNAIIFRALGDAIAVSGKSGPAMELYRQALEVNKDHIGTILSRTALMVTTGYQLAEAENEIQSILIENRRGHLASRGQRGWAYLILAKLRLRKGSMDMAKSFIFRARSNMPSLDAPFLDALASILIESFHLGEASKVVQQSRNFMKNRPHPYYLMAQIHQRHGLPESALRDLDQAKGIEFAQANVLRAQINLELGNLQVAETEVDRALVMSDLLEAHIIKAKVMAARGQGDKAAQKLETLLRIHPNSSKLLTALGEVFLSMQKIQEAKDRLNEALRKDKHAFDAQLMLAQVNEKEGNYKEARNQLSAASRENYGNIYALKELARLEADIGDLTEAATNYQRVIIRIPKDPQARLALAAIYTEQRKFKEAHAEIRTAKKNQAEKGALALAEGRLALWEDRIDEAITLLTQAKNSQKKSSEPWELLILANIKKGDNELVTKAALKDLAQMFPQGPELEIESGRIELEAGRPLPALNRFQKALKLLEDNPRPPTKQAEIHVLLARVFLERGQMRKAEEECKQAIEVCPICPSAYYYRGRVQEQRKAKAEAYKSYQQAIKLDPKLKDAYFDLAWMYEVDGQIGKAIENMKKYIPLETNKEVRDTAIRDLKSFEERQ